MKKLLAVILAITMLLSVIPFAVSAEDVALTYTFSGENADDAGYAQGTITYTAQAEGTYYLYWADDEKALDKYFEIASFTLGAGQTGTFKFPAQVAIPADAEKVIVSTEKASDTAVVSNAVAQFDIPDSKKLFDSVKERQYRYAALSDIHIDRQHGSDAGYYVNADKNWAQTLDVCVDREVDFIISAGDQVSNAWGATQEWLTYQQILAESDYVNPIYEADGNHEPRGSANSNCDVACSNEEYSLATGLDADAQSIVENKDYYEVTEPTTGDHFIFMSEVNAHPGENDNFSKEQLDWLEGLLAKYKGDGKKIFLIQHALIQGYGAGDDTFDPGYQGGIRMQHAETGEQFPNNQRFKAIIEANKEIIWYSGHTHIDFRENQNYSSENGTSCHMVHIPSACNTASYVKDENGNKYLGTSTDYTFYDDATQGYIVDVFDGATILNGTNLYYNKIYPKYTYLIEEGEPIERETEETQPRPTQPVPTQPEFEDGQKIYCINSTNWAEIYTYTWPTGGNGTVAWPGYPMTKTSQTVNGFAVYEATVDTTHTNVIFNNNDSGSQTNDLTIVADQYYDLKSGTWYASLDDVPELNALATDRYLVGEFNGWSTIANEFKLNAEGDSTAYVTMTLEANKTYQFKVVREGTWTSCSTPITDSVEGLTFSKSVSGNAKITTKEAGDYVFSFGIASSQLGVVYPEPVEEPSSEEPTQPPSSEEPSVEPSSESPSVEPIIYGDVNGDGGVAIIDATLIQRHVAKIITLTDEQKERAAVSGNAEPAIVDATLVQRHVAKIIDKFPVEKVKFVATVSADESDEDVFKKATDYLAKYFQYASYDTYQALKKVVYKYKDTDTTALSDEAKTELSGAIADFDALREKVHQQTVYFTDGNAYGNIRAYYFNSATDAIVEAWPGQIGSYIQTNSYGQNIYAVTLNFSKYDTIVFSSDGNNKTADIALDGCSGKLYYPTELNADGAWDVAETTFKQMWYGEQQEEVGGDVAEDVTIYFTDTLGWSAVNCYYWAGSKNNTWPGQQMEFVRNNSQGQPIYSITLPAGASVVFNDGNGTQSTDIVGVTGGTGYYLTTLSSGKYLYETYTYGE